MNGMLRKNEVVFRGVKGNSGAGKFKAFSPLEEGNNGYKGVNQKVKEFLVFMKKNNFHFLKGYDFYLRFPDGEKKKVESFEEVVGPLEKGAELDFVSFLGEVGWTSVLSLSKNDFEKLSTQKLLDKMRLSHVISDETY